MLATVETLLERVAAWLKYVAAALLIGVACLIAVDVFLRGVLNHPIIGVAEIVANGIVIIAFLQLAYAVRIGAMLRSDLLVGFLPIKAKAAFEAVAAILGIIFFALIAWSSWTPMMRAIASGEFEGHASFQVPTWPVRVVIVSCSVLAIANYVAVALRALSGRPIPKMDAH